MIDILTSKVLPHDIYLEQRLLCSILLDSIKFEDVSDLICEGDFYKSGHQYIFASMKNLILSKNNIDLVTVATDLKKNDLLESIGGPVYLAKLTDEIPIHSNTEYIVNEIKELSIRRKTISNAYEIIEKAYDGSENISEFSNKKISEIEDTRNKDTFYSMLDLSNLGLDRIEKSNSDLSEKGYNIGFSNFNELCSIIGSKLIIIAARPGMGKTALALTISRNLAAQNIMNGILSIEMDKEQLFDRALSSITGINTMRLTKYKGIKDDEWEYINESAEKLSKLPIIIDDTGSVTIEDVERKCRKMIKAGCKVIFIDQLSKIKGRRGQNDFERYTENCNRIADLKKELRIPIFLLSQLNRDIEKRPLFDREPKISDLKQTGALEEDADMIFFIHRPEVYETDENMINELKGKTILSLSKHRQGATFRDSKINFNEKTTTFTDGWIERIHI